MKKLIRNYYFVDVAAVILLILYNYLTREWNQLHLIGLVLIAAFLPFWLLAREQLGKSFMVRPKAVKLVTSGLYSKFRNPIYLFSSIVVFAAVLPSKSSLQFSILLLLLTVQLLRIKKEERVLAKKFGRKYLNYQKSTLF